MERPWLVPVTYALSALATALAWVVARRRAEHRPIALLLTLGLASDAVRRLLFVYAIGPGYVVAAGGPLTGAARGAFHVEQALFLAWPAAFTAAALAIFLKRRPWLVAGAWALMSGAVIVAYPTIRGASLQRVYLGVQAVSLAASCGFLLAWFRSADRGVAVAHGCIALVLVTELVSLMIGPWRADLFTAWPIAQGSYAVVFLSLILMQGGALWMTR
jgi:hypothetical protein